METTLERSDDATTRVTKQPTVADATGTSPATRPQTISSTATRWGRRGAAAIGRSLLGWALPLVAVLWWFLATRHVSVTDLFPSPGQVWDRTVELTRSGDLFAYIGQSTRRALAGFTLGGGIGFLLGLFTGLSKWTNLLLNNTIQMLRNIPVLAVIPLALVWFGIGEEVKIYLVAFGVFFLVYANTYHGIRSIDPKLVEMSRVYGMSPWKRFANVVLPGAMPSILVGVRLALGVMWLVLIAAETVATDEGIGYMAMSARNVMQMDTVVLSIILYSILGKLSDVVAVVLEKSLVRWKKL